MTKPSALKVPGAARNYGKENIYAKFVSCGL